MERDAYDAGVQVGGLKNRTEIRILICYLLSNMPTPIGGDLLKETLHFEGIANYFEVGFALSDLLVHGSIEQDETAQDGGYRITQAGKDVAQTLQRTVPLTVRERALAAVQKKWNRRRNERQSKTKIEKNERGFLASCTLMDDGEEWMTVRLYAPDEETARMIIDAFLDDPAAVFNGVAQLLIRPVQTSDGSV